MFIRFHSGSIIATHDDEVFIQEQFCNFNIKSNCNPYMRTNMGTGKSAFHSGDVSVEAGYRLDRKSSLRIIVGHTPRYFK